MRALYENKPLLYKLVNKQFQMMGINEDIAELERKDNIVEVDKKKKLWWNVYFFDCQERYEAWKLWCKKELEKHYKEGVEQKLNFLDLAYGLNFKEVHLSS